MFLSGDYVSFYHLLSSVRFSCAVRLVTFGTRRLHLRLLICAASDAASVLRSSSSLVMVLGQHTPRIFRRHLFWKVSSFPLAWLSVVITPVYTLSCVITPVYTLSITNKTKPSTHKYSLSGQPLSTVSSHSYLGVKLDSKLTWTNHVTDNLRNV